MQLQKIDIDFEIHKLIEAERQNFEEPPYVALRRLLKLPPSSASKVEAHNRPEQGIPFVEEGVSIPHGSLARMEYQRGKQVYEGQFLNGKLVVNDQSFDALSPAAVAFAVTKKGGSTSLNGWVYWHAKFPGETNWRSLWDMREEVRKAAR